MQAAHAGATEAAYVIMRLPNELKDLFREWLAEHYPQRAEHVMSVIRDMRGGRDNDPRFGARMTGTGHYAELLQEMVLPKLEQIQKAAHTDPQLVETLAILAQRDIALTIAALMSICAWMVDAARGKVEGEP